MLLEQLYSKSSIILSNSSCYLYFNIQPIKKYKNKIISYLITVEIELNDFENHNKNKIYSYHVKIKNNIEIIPINNNKQIEDIYNIIKTELEKIPNNDFDYIEFEYIYNFNKKIYEKIQSNVKIVRLIRSEYV